MADLVTSMDFSETAIAVQRKRHSRANLSVLHFVHSDVSNMIFGDSSFDVQSVAECHFLL